MTCAIGALLLALSPAPLDRDDAVRSVVFTRLYQDYCAWDRKLKAVYPSVGWTQTAPSKPLLIVLDGRFSKRILDPSRLPVDVMHAHKELTDPASKGNAAQLAVRDVKWLGDRAIVHGEYGRSAPFRQWVSYTVAKVNGSWQVRKAGVYSGDDVSVLTGRKGKHTFRVRLTQRPFNLKAHRITLKDPKNIYSYLVDGSHARGTDGGVPMSEMSGFTAQVDGKQWNVPSKLWKDIYNPNLRQLEGEANYVSATLSKDGATLNVLVGCSDGAGSYSVHWILRKNGRHSRKIEQGEC